MNKKMTWEEMKKAYPDEWLLITDYDLDKYGEIKIGIVQYHTHNMDDIAKTPTLRKNTAFRYTGEPNFRGLRPCHTQPRFLT